MLALRATSRAARSYKTAVNRASACMWCVVRLVICVNRSLYMPHMHMRPVECVVGSECVVERESVVIFRRQRALLGFVTYAEFGGGVRCVTCGFWPLCLQEPKREISGAGKSRLSKRCIPSRSEYASTTKHGGAMDVEYRLCGVEQLVRAISSSDDMCIGVLARRHFP